MLTLLKGIASLRAFKSHVVLTFAYYSPVLFDGNLGFDEDISAWDTSSVTTMVSMFQNAEEFTGTGINNWNVESVSDASFIFKDAINFNVNLGSWNFAELRAIKGAFQGALSFTGGAVGNWDVSRVEDFTQV